MKVLAVALAAVGLLCLAEARPGLSSETTKDLMRALRMLEKMEKEPEHSEGMAKHHTTTPAPRKAIHKSAVSEPLMAKNADAKNYVCENVQMGPDVTMGYFSSVNYGYSEYPANMECKYVIQAPAGKRVKLTFQAFNLENFYDSVKIYDGSSENSNELRSLTGDLTQQLPIEVISNGEYMTVLMKSDFSVQAPGFTAMYEWIDGSSSGGNTGGNTGSIGGNSGSSATGDYPTACVYAHNNVRQRHGVNDLQWDENLAAGAQTWANSLNGGSIYHDPNLPDGQGENIYTGSIGMANTVYECSDATFAWYDEVNSPGYDYNNPGFSSGTGHFTQVVWAATTHVGCGTASTGATSTIIVCRYSPPGNMNGATYFNNNVPRLSSGQSYPANLRELEANPCHDKAPASECSSAIGYGWCSSYDFVKDVCWSSCEMC